jgi:two-component system NtrC family sensor kinase
MENEVIRISETVKGLLDFASPSEPKIEKISAEGIIQKTLFLIAHQISLQNIEITEKYSNKSLYFHADFKQIQQVLLNLILNAAQAMPDGGRIIISCSKERNENAIVIKITDTGSGISPDNLEKIFDPFFTTKLESKGTGLGLSTAYSIMVKNGGHIEVKSKVGKGTTVILKLPQ